MMPSPARALGLSLSISFAALAVACGSAKTPDAVKAELAQGPSDTVTVVMFDYECPFCIAAHTELAKALQASPGLKVRFVRHHVPLPSHPHAEMAARAAICVETLGGRTETMGDALFAAGSARLNGLPYTGPVSATQVKRDRMPMGPPEGAVDIIAIKKKQNKPTQQKHHHK